MKCDKNTPPPHSFLGSSVPWMIMHAVAPNTWCFAPRRFCSPSFLPSFATLFFHCASAPFLKPRLEQHLCYRKAFLRSFVCLMPHLCCSICSSSLRLGSHLKTCCLSVLLCLCYSVFFFGGMSDSSSSLQFTLYRLGSRTRSCCLAGSFCLMN